MALRQKFKQFWKTGTLTRENINPVRTPLTVLTVLILVGLFSIISGVLTKGSDFDTQSATTAYRDLIELEIQAYEDLLKLQTCEALPTNTLDDPTRIPQIVPIVPPVKQTELSPDDSSDPDVKAQQSPVAPILPPLDPGKTPLPEVAEETEGEETENAPSSLQDLIDQATVLVILQTRDDTKVSTVIGSGFFVSPTEIVTNRHVIEEAIDTSPIYIGSRALGRIHQVEIVATSPGQEFGQRDLALLRLPEPVGASPVTFTSNLQRLQNVIAAGYPFLVMETDPRFIALRNNLQAALSEANMPFNVPTLGRVMAVQPGPAELEIVLHRAIISPGNSGGPLLDECGRLVGVNTFLTPNDAPGDAIFYALGAGDTANFLSENGVDVATSDGACVVGGTPAPEVPQEGEAGLAADDQPPADDPAQEEDQEEVAE